MNFHAYKPIANTAQNPFFTVPVPAGHPQPVEATAEWLNIDEYVRAGSPSVVYIRVFGDSMEDVGIHDGDLLVVRRTESARSGEVVIADINGEFTIKRLNQEQNHLYLVPANGKYPKREIKKKDLFSVWAVVTHIIHKL